MLWSLFRYVCVLGVLLGTAVHARCTLDVSVDFLLSDLTVASRLSGSLPEPVHRAISASLQAVQTSEDLAADRMWEDPALSGLLDDIVGIASAAVTDRRLAKPGVAHAKVHRLRAEWASRCSDLAQTAVFGSTGAALTQTVSSVPGTAVTATIVPLQVHALRVSAILAGLIAFAVTLVLLEFGVRRAHIAVFHRRSCLIPAHLEAGMVRIEGAVTLFSKEGAVFSSSDKVIMDFEGGMLIVGAFKFPCRIAPTQTGALDCVFRQRVSTQDHRMVLNRSLISTHAAKAGETPFDEVEAKPEAVAH